MYAGTFEPYQGIGMFLDAMLEVSSAVPQAIAVLVGSTPGADLPGCEAIAQALDYRRDRLPVQNWTAHDLRRTVCTHLAKMGVPPLHRGNSSVRADFMCMPSVAAMVRSAMRSFSMPIGWWSFCSAAIED